MQFLDILDNMGYYRKVDELIKYAYDNAAYSHIDPLAVLGLSRENSLEDAKKKYRELARKYHPDVNPAGEEKFKELGAALAMLQAEPERYFSRDSSQTQSEQKDPYDKYMDFQESGSEPVESTHTQPNQTPDFIPLFRFVKSMQFVEFYYSDKLVKYYKYQIGKLRKSYEQLEAKDGIKWLRDSLNDLIQPYYDLKTTMSPWSGNLQQMINILSFMRAKNKDVDEAIEQLFRYVKREWYSAGLYKDWKYSK